MDNFFIKNKELHSNKLEASFDDSHLHDDSEEENLTVRVSTKWGIKRYEINKVGF